MCLEGESRSRDERTGGGKEHNDIHYIQIGLKMSKVYAATSLIGGGTGALDAIDGDLLLDQDFCLVNESGVLRPYTLDEDSALAESPPDTIAPDSNPGTKRWLLMGIATGLTDSTITDSTITDSTITGGAITGITDLAIEDGGTSASTAQDAINALSAVSGATNEHVLTKDTATGNAVFKANVGGIPVAAAGGTVDAITADYTPDVTLADQKMVAVVAAGANTSTTPTFAPDGLTAHTIVKNGGSALVAGDIAGAGHVIILGYNLANTRWEILNPAANPAVGLSRLQQLIDNLSIAATVGSKALTVAVKGEDGNNCSASNVHTIGFRSATLTDGKPVPRTLQAASSIVLPSGATLGFAANGAGRIYVWEIDNAGTVEPALSRTADIFPESNLVSTTAIGADSDSASVMYSTTARTNVACRCIGYIEITTGATPGEWDNAPTKIQIMGPGVKRTGDVVQEVVASTAEVATGTNVLPYPLADTTVTQAYINIFLSQEVTFTSVINKYRVDALAYLSTSDSPYRALVASIFKDSDNAMAVGAHVVASSGMLIPIPVSIPPTLIPSTSPITFKLGGASTSSSATITINGTAGARVLGGALVSQMKIKEVFA